MLDASRRGYKEMRYSLKNEEAAYRRGRVGEDPDKWFVVRRTTKKGKRETVRANNPIWSEQKCENTMAPARGQPVSLSVS